MTNRMEAQVIVGHRFPSVIAFGGVEYTKKEWTPVPPQSVDQLPHPYLNERPMKTPPLSKARLAAMADEKVEGAEAPVGAGDLFEVFGAKIAEALIANDIADSTAVAEMSDDELNALPGIGKATVKRIRKALE